MAPAAPNNEGVAVVAPLVAVVVAPLAGVELVGVLTSGFLKRLRPELPPAAGVEDPAAPKRLGVGAADDVAALSLSLSPPPRVNPPPKDGVAAGCEAAGVDPPKLNVGGLLAGVVLESAPPPKSPPAGLGVS